ncbi:MAG: proton-conducting transporter membrane subunit [Methanomassiliicoccales archaeon]
MTEVYDYLPIAIFGAAAVAGIWSRKASYLLDVAASVALVALLFSPADYVSYFVLIASLAWILISVFSLGYDLHYGRWLSSLMALTMLGMAVILISGTYLVFIAGWEVMSLAAYGIIGMNSKSHGPPYVFMMFSEISTVLIITGSVLAVFRDGSFVTSYTPLSSDLPLLFIGLGCIIKMGIVPFMISEWLPIAHGSAPANASAMLSATMTLMGVFMIYKLIGISPDSAAIGIFFLASGAISVLFASLYAYISENMKMLGGFSTIENNGAILSALGLLLMVQGGTFRLFVSITVIVFALAHSLGKTGLFMTAGASGHELFHQVDSMGSYSLKLGSIISMASLSGLFPTIGGLGVWMLLESFFMEAYAGGLLGVIAIVVGSVIAIGEGMATGAMVKMISFTQIYPGGRDKLVSGRTVFATAILLITLFLVSPLMFPAALKGAVPGTLVFYGFTIESKFGPADFGLVSPLYIAGLIVVFSVAAYAFFGNPSPRKVTGWNMGRSDRTIYTSYSYSSNIRLMLRRILRTRVSAKGQSLSVADVFWESMIALANGYRRFARGITYAIMNSSIGRYILYMILAFMLVLLISVYVF